jgi:hypothetical protein
MNVFLKFQTMVEHLFNTKIKSVQTDWGGKYRPLNKFFQSIGIVHCLSCLHTHQQQGCAERKHGHIIDTTLALLAESGVPKHFWDEACQTPCYLINCLPTPTLQHISPFQKLFGKPPDYSLKNLGVSAYQISSLTIPISLNFAQKPAFSWVTVLITRGIGAFILRLKIFCVT